MMVLNINVSEIKRSQTISIIDEIIYHAVQCYFSRNGIPYQRHWQKRWHGHMQKNTLWTLWSSIRPHVLAHSCNLVLMPALPSFSNCLKVCANYFLNDSYICYVHYYTHIFPPVLLLMKGSKDTQEYHWLGCVHVRDVAAAQILLLETPSASGRHLCTNGIYQFKDFAETVAKLCPVYNVHR